MYITYITLCELYKYIYIQSLSNKIPHEHALVFSFKTFTLKIAQCFSVVSFARYILCTKMHYTQLHHMNDYKLLLTIFFYCIILNIAWLVIRLVNFFSFSLYFAKISTIFFLNVYVHNV